MRQYKSFWITLQNLYILDRNKTTRKSLNTAALISVKTMNIYRHKYTCSVDGRVY